MNSLIDNVIIYDTLSVCRDVRKYLNIPRVVSARSPLALNPGSDQYWSVGAPRVCLISQA